ncbi:DNA polymerase III subunit gamma and tau, partial [Streptomyces sp. NPDC059698]
PGGWPTASAPGSGPAPAAPPPAAAPAAPQAPAASPAGQAAPDGGQNMAQGAVQVRNMWPDILEAVKNRRRFTWILLSQNAQVAGFDGTTLQLGFLNAGARDNFASSGSEEVLKQALAERFNAQWRIEAVVDPSGGGAAPGPGGRPAPQYQPAPAAPAPVAYEPRPQHAPPQQSPATPQGQHAPSGPTSPSPSAPPQGRGAPSVSEASSGPYGAEPPRSMSIEDDIPEADDPDLVDSALSGHELIVRELGATVVEEYPNEQ